MFLPHLLPSILPQFYWKLSHLSFAQVEFRYNNDKVRSTRLLKGDARNYHLFVGLSMQKVHCSKRATDFASSTFLLFVGSLLLLSGAISKEDEVDEPRQNNSAADNFSDRVSSK